MHTPLPPRVIATDAALALIAQLTGDHGPILFHQSGGCCDGSAPMCFPRGEFLVGGSDIKLGEIGGAPFYMSESQFEYWRHTQLIIDVVPGNGGMFSIERATGMRFLTRSRLFTDEEADRLAAVPPQRATVDYPDLAA
ncbi:DUF779 domain-containing protein [Cupriavidus cauae]|uniref:DUF779 domain-containing protein n=1 Tax=Cupriavidus cauae TaxID=2608999 RepID=A0A5M8AEE9_9BURK|nr:DUF779 domain-containing protein [Cupriavidus cauae]KAA0180033.1 DUF779 domain-containing protein [Cupriavidus gilardii]KAA6120200.1 DUF779 domain-containing protein [Cupriavidus cauae]